MFDYIESPVRVLGVGGPEEEGQPFFNAVKASGLCVEAFNKFVLAEQPIVGPDVSDKGLRAFVEGIVSRIDRLNTSIIVLGSGGARAIPEGWDRHRARDQFLSFCALVAHIVGPDDRDRADCRNVLQLNSHGR